MTDQEKSDLENRIFFSPSPWREVLRWLNESRQEGWKLPEDRAAFVGNLVLLASDLSGPKVRGQK